MEPVTVCLLTYNRLDYAIETLRSTLDNLQTAHPLHVHIASDGDTQEYIDELRHLAGGYAHVKGVGYSSSMRRGYGANYNLAMQLVHSFSRYVVCLEDDWRLQRVLELDPILACLDTSPEIGCIRMGYIGFTQELRGKIVDSVGHKYFVFDPNSPEPHVFAGHPRVEAVAWQKEVGAWPEGLAPGATEFAVCHIPNARKRVAWPLDNLPCSPWYTHIGARRSY